MGKQGKKQRHLSHQRRGKASYYLQEDGDGDHYSHTSLSTPTSGRALSDPENESQEEGENEREDNCADRNSLTGEAPSKFWLYQQSVQSPKGDISYLQKFFLMYIGGRVPLHLQEDFCGSALLSTEWLHGDPRRTAVGLDLDLEALHWCMQNNMDKIGVDSFSRISLFHGDVLQPQEARLVKFEGEDLATNIVSNSDSSIAVTGGAALHGSSGAGTYDKLMKNSQLPARDIVCAFNYSCCCLHTRRELLSYFKHVHSTFSRKGGIFVMDLYGGTSSECELRMQRRFSNFTYVWEQAAFDIIQRKTRISLHFSLQKQQKKLHHAFSYSWRLWSLPEVKDCLEEAGFQAVHFWIRQMPDSEDIRTTEGFGAGRDVKYEEAASFQQQDSWNAYIVGVA